MSTLAYFGIESSGLNTAIGLLIVFVVVLYVASVYWTYADARRRIQDPMLIGGALVGSLFAFVGPIVYMVVRPPEYLEDVRERELETQAAEARLRQLEQSLCPHCDYRIEPDFIRCPSCLRKLKERCANCSRPLDQAWTICPYCEADVPGLNTKRSRRRRGAQPLEDELGEIETTNAGEPLTEPLAEAKPAPAQPALATEDSAAARRAAARASARTRPSS